MSKVGTQQLEAWFFTSGTGIRFVSGDEPDQVAFENFMASVCFHLEPGDAADAAQTQQGLVMMPLFGDINAAVNTKNIGLGVMSLCVGPNNLPVVLLSGGTVTVTPATSGSPFITYTLPAYLIANQGDVALTSLTGGQILVYNSGSSKWVNTGLYYQTVYSVSTAKPVEPGLSFSAAFVLTDNTTLHATVIDIATNAVTYAKIQNTATGNVLIGNIGSSAGPLAEITPMGFTLVAPAGGSNGVLAANSLDVIGGSTYSITLGDFNSGKIKGFTYPATNTVAVALPNPSTVPPGLILRLKDLSGNAGTKNITITQYASEKIDGQNTLVISTNYGHYSLITDGTNWYTV